MAASKAAFYKEGQVIEHTPSAALTGGTPTQLSDGIVGIPSQDIGASVKGNLRIAGIVKIEKTQVAGNLGDNVWYDSDGDPYGGTSGSGAATVVASAGNFWLGTLAKAAAATDTHAYVRLNVENPRLPAWPEKVHETKTDDYTMDAQDSGKVMHIATDAKVFTLPSTSVGLEYIFVNDGADAAVLLSVSPAAIDKIMGPDIAGTDDKDQQNTKLTAIRGDWIHIRSEGTAGWYIIGKRGIWAEEG